MKIYIVGTGMDGRKTLTAEALEAVMSAEVLIGAKRMLEPFFGLGKRCFESWRYEEICAFIDDCGDSDTAVLMSGDCGFFSGAEKLSEMLRGRDVSIIPGIASPVYFCAKIKKPWKDMRFVDLHGKTANIVRSVSRAGYCFFLLGGGISPAGVCARLREYGMGGITVHTGEDLGYPDERILTGTADDLASVSFGKLAVMVTENPGYERGIRFGIPDSEFIRGEVPMTKSEVRAAVMSKLGIGEQDMVWDIGCGTGSVSVECALQCTDGTVWAVDKSAEACDITRRNGIAFHCDNINVREGDISGVLPELPKPDAVFVGGASGRTAEIAEAAFRGGNSPRFVVTAVTLETLNEAVSALESRGMTAEVTQIAVTRTRKAGSHTMLAAQNPVFIIEGKK